MSALHFTVLGAGEVVEKFWLTAESLGLVIIDHIISLESPTEFASRFPNHIPRYHQSTSPQETIEIVKTLGATQNIALVFPVGKTEMAKMLLSLSPNYFIRIFWEKPFIDSPGEISEIQRLIRDYPNRIHLTSKYALSRADILYPYLPKGEIPEKITAVLLEGSPYFLALESRRKPNFMRIGPEADLGFHLLDIISTVCRTCVSPITEIRFTTSDVQELEGIIPKFLPHMGFQAKITLHLENEKSIPVFLQAGKFDGDTLRYIQIDYKNNLTFRQEYTYPIAIDPVTKTENNQSVELARHKERHHYYGLELTDELFTHQLPAEQFARLYLNEICLKLKAARLQSSTG